MKSLIKELTEIKQHLDNQPIQKGYILKFSKEDWVLQIRHGIIHLSLTDLDNAINHPDKYIGYSNGWQCYLI